MVRSCATQDDVNKDYVCTPTISPGINRPPHPDHLAYTLSFGTTKHAKHERTPSLNQEPREKVSFTYDGEAALRIRSTAEGEASTLGEQQERRDRAQEQPDERETTRASAKQAAVHRGGSGELLLRT